MVKGAIQISVSGLNMAAFSVEMWLGGFRV